MAASKCVTNLERAGDEARKVAKRLCRIHENGGAQAINTTELKRSGELALTALRKALDAFARMDVMAAAQIVLDDEAVDSSCRAFGRRAVMQMKELEPRFQRLRLATRSGGPGNQGKLALFCS